MVDIDIDRLDEASRVAKLFSVDRLNLFSFSRQDHGAKDGTSLRQWADQQFDLCGLTVRCSEVRLITFPRFLNYKFSPISLWLGFDADDSLAGIIYEVNNTFGETHIYVARTPANIAEHSAPKRLHVSPFFDVTGQYSFRIRHTDEMTKLVVSTVEDAARTHTAALAVRRQVLNDKALLKLAAQRPFSSQGVTAGIHFEAIKLWRKGAKYRSRPPLPASSVTVAKSGIIE